MKSAKFAFCALLAAFPALSSGAEPDASGTFSEQPLRYSGMCDASAAVALDGETFLVADDERNTLQIYRADRPGTPQQSIPWNGPLDIPSHDEHPEADLEGAATLDGRIYWIASHGRNRKGKWRANRHRFFAMTVTKSGDRFVAEPFGRTCKTLMLDLVRDERMRAVGLAEALDAGRKESADLAPKKRGLNVEGLCAAADGKSLLIAFRNPLHDGRALLVPLLNPADVLRRAADPRFGDPIELRLQAKIGDAVVPLGIRSIEYSQHHAAYLIAAGPSDPKKAFALFRWSPTSGEPPRLLRKATETVNRIGDFTPEALIVYPGERTVQLLSDDGTLKVRVRSPRECAEGAYEDGWCEAKYLLDDARKTFRSIRIDPE